MLGRVKMLRRVPVLRVVAAPDVPAASTQPQVHPGITSLQALLTPPCLRFADLDLIEMRALV